MANESMLERVAKALDPDCFEESFLKLYGKQITDDLRSDALSSASAAIEAMRVPTISMLDGACYVGPDTNSGEFSRNNAIDVWIAMIDSALQTEIASPND